MVVVMLVFVGELELLVPEERMSRYGVGCRISGSADRTLGLRCGAGAGGGGVICTISLR